VTGKQLAVASAGTGNIPLQLVAVTQPTGAGQFAGFTHVQRLNTVGGVAPQLPCDAQAAGQETKVAYQADYVFYSAPQR